MSYQIQLENFQGPFELLFHLIEQDEIDIYDIPIARITYQYLEYLNSITKMDISSAGEFLLMAAKLIEIKSQMLLPKPSALRDMEDELDPREDLIAQLLEYKYYRELAVQLGQLIAGQDAYFTRSVRDVVVDATPSGPLKNLSVVLLVDALEGVMKTRPHFAILDSKVKEINVNQKVHEILEYLAGEKRAVSFEELLGSTNSHFELIGYFLALLELIHINKIKVFQREVFGEIFIILRKEW